MNHKKLAKILWHGIDIPVPATDNHLEGLNPGEIYICDDDLDPSIYILTAAGNVKKISGSQNNIGDVVKSFMKILVPIDKYGNVVMLEDGETPDFANQTGNVVAVMVTNNLAFCSQNEITAHYNSADDSEEGSEIFGGTLVTLRDVSVSDLADKQVLMWDAETGKWINGAGGGGSNVQFTPSQQSGNVIGVLTINGKSQTLFSKIQTSVEEATHASSADQANSLKNGRYLWGNFFNGERDVYGPITIKNSAGTHSVTLSVDDSGNLIVGGNMLVKGEYTAHYNGSSDSGGTPDSGGGGTGTTQYTYRIVFNTNGGSGSVANVTFNSDSATSDISSSIPSKSGDTFIGWAATSSYSRNRIAYSESNGGVADNNNVTAKLTASSWNINTYVTNTGGSLTTSGSVKTLTLYAQWMSMSSEGSGSTGGGTTDGETYTAYFQYFSDGYIDVFPMQTSNNPDALMADGKEGFTYYGYWKGSSLSNCQSKWMESSNNPHGTSRTVTDWGTSRTVLFWYKKN